MKIDRKAYMRKIDIAVKKGDDEPLLPTYIPPLLPTLTCPDYLFKDTIALAEHHLYGSSRLGVKSYLNTVLGLAHEHVHNYQQYVMQLNDQKYDQSPERELLAIEFSLFPNEGHMRNIMNNYAKSKETSWTVEFDDRLSNGALDMLKQYAERRYNSLPITELKEQYKSIYEKIQNREYNEDAIK